MVRVEPMVPVAAGTPPWYTEPGTLSAVTARLHVVSNRGLSPGGNRTVLVGPTLEAPPLAGPAGVPPVPGLDR